MLIAVFFSFFLFSACDKEEESSSFEGLELLKWNLIVPDNELALCGNGSPFKFFINPSNKSKNVLLYFQGGGACWDYESCSGQAGIRGAANPLGIPDDFMETGVPAIMSPFIWRDHPLDDYKTRDWTLIFIPYCTGDIFTGNNVITYKDPEGIAPDLVWHHAGHETVMAILEWMTTGQYSKEFEEIPQLLVTGSSAGGAGSFLNYYFIREALGSRVGQGILLNDSGPIYPAEDKPEYPEDLSLLDGDGPHTYENYAHSVPCQRKVMSAWGTDTVIDLVLKGIEDDEALFAMYNPNNIGLSLTRLLSYKYLNDRIAHTQFSMDENYSSYLYERFFPNDINMEADGIDMLHTYWLEEQQVLIDLYDDLNETNGNTGYFIPYFRPFIESHTVCTVASFGTLIDRDINGDYINVDMKAFIVDLLNPEIPMSQLRYIENPSELEAEGPIPTVIREVVDQLTDFMDSLEN